MLSQLTKLKQNMGDKIDLYKNGSEACLRFELNTFLFLIYIQLIKWHLFHFCDRTT